MYTVLRQLRIIEDNSINFVKLLVYIVIGMIAIPLLLLVLGYIVGMVSVSYQVARISMLSFADFMKGLSSGGWAGFLILGFVGVFIAFLTGYFSWKYRQRF